MSGSLSSLCCLYSLGAQSLFIFFFLTIHNALLNTFQLTHIQQIVTSVHTRRIISVFFPLVLVLLEGLPAPQFTLSKSSPLLYNIFKIYPGASKMAHQVKIPDVGLTYPELEP